MTTRSCRKLSHCQQQSSSALHLPGLPHLTFLEKQHDWNYMNIWKSYFRMAGWKGKCKEDHHSFKCNFRSCKKKAWKKNSGLCGIQTFDHCNSITNWDILIQASCEWLNLKTSSKQAICEFKKLSLLKWSWLQNLFLWKWVLFAWE